MYLKKNTEYVERLTPILLILNVMIVYSSIMKTVNHWWLHYGIETYTQSNKFRAFSRLLLMTHTGL